MECNRWVTSIPRPSSCAQSRSYWRAKTSWAPPRPVPGRLRPSPCPFSRMLREHRAHRAASSSSPRASWRRRWRSLPRLRAVPVRGNRARPRRRRLRQAAGGDRRTGVDVLVATPGRLLDFMVRRRAEARGIQYLVLDEVDRMLDMGFLPQVRQHRREDARSDRQTLFFSATLPPEIERMTKWVLERSRDDRDRRRASPGRNRHTRAVSGGQGPEIRPARRSCWSATKFDSVHHLLRAPSMVADASAHQLKACSHAVAVHARRPLAERARARRWKVSRPARYEVLVATDIAARGLDIASVSHVINYDVPGASGGLRPPHRPHRPCACRRAMPSRSSPRRSSTRSARSSGSSGAEHPPGEAGRLRVSLHRALQ